MINAQGQVKIMDFGLAQVGDRTRITKTGSSLGTPAYMSPEQVKGETTDRRTDLWSLGVTLYEMLSGRLPFPGETEQALSFGIVHSEPEPLTAMRSGLPGDLDRLAGKCLNKRADERYQTAADLEVDLRHLPRTPGSKPPGIANRSRRTLAWILAGLAAAAALIWIGRGLRPPEAPVVMRMTLPMPPGAEAADPGRMLGSPMASPNGESVVVALATGDTTHLFFRRLNSNELVRLDGTRAATNPFWSPDSKSMGFFADGSLKRTTPAGGNPQVLCALPSGGGNRGGAWSRSGVIAFGINGQGIFRVPDTGGEPAVVTALDPGRTENSHRYPIFLPDGNRFLYFARTTKPEYRGIYLDSLDRKTSRRKVLVADGQFALGHDPASGRYHLLTQQNGKIVAQQFDLENGDVSGDPRVISELGGQVSVSGTGLLVARSEKMDLARLVWLDRSGREIGVIGPPDDYWDLRLSPDERIAAVTRHDYLSGYFAVWLADLSRGYLTSLSTEPDRCQGPVWSPDGRFVYFQQYAGQQGIYRRAATGQGTQELFLPSVHNEQIRDISADGTQILAERHKSGDPMRTNSRSIIERTPHGTSQWQSIGGVGLSQMNPRFSPDRNLIAYDSEQSGVREVYVLDSASQNHRISDHGGRQPVWRGDGKELFYLSKEGYITSVELRRGIGAESLKPKPLFKVTLRQVADGPLFDVTRDGQRFLVISGRDSGTQSALDVILNWTSLLR